MNDKRRRRLSKVWSELESIIDEEQEALDNLPEGLECSQRAEDMEHCIGELEEAKDLVGEHQD